MKRTLLLVMLIFINLSMCSCDASDGLLKNLAMKISNINCCIT